MSAWSDATGVADDDDKEVVVRTISQAEANSEDLGPFKLTRIKSALSADKHPMFPTPKPVSFWTRVLRFLGFTR